jgi:hypothetical protein
LLNLEGKFDIAIYPGLRTVKSKDSRQSRRQAGNEALSKFGDEIKFEVDKHERGLAVQRTRSFM